MFLFLFHCDSNGLAAAKIDVRAFNWQMMPALAMLSVCCSITSCKTLRVESFILSNSSMQQTPLSANTNAPLPKIKIKINIYYYSRVNEKWKERRWTYVCNTSCLVSGSLVTYAVNPTADEPRPDVYCERGTKLYTYWSNCDFDVPGSPHNSKCISDRKFCRPNETCFFLVPPNNCSKMPFLMSVFS